MDLLTKLSSDLLQLLENESHSDVTFVIDGVRFPAHRIILASRSEYFRALLFGGLSESSQDEINMNHPVVAFKETLSYIYSGKLSLNSLQEDDILDILGLADLFILTELQGTIRQNLLNVIGIENCSKIFNAARIYNQEKLLDACYLFIDTNAKDLLSHESFLDLMKESLCAILSRDSFFAPEMDIFLAVEKWCRHNSDYSPADVQNVVKHLRLSLMKPEQLLNEVRSSGLIELDHLLDALNEVSTDNVTSYRAATWPEKNVATAEFDSKTIEGEFTEFLLDGNFTDYNCDRGFTSHLITEDRSKSIVVELGRIRMINHIRMLLWYKEDRFYSYYIEVCVNRKHWDRVVDYQSYLCYSWQELYFPSRPVKYIRIVGTHNTSNKEFHVVHLEAKFTVKMPLLKGNIVVQRDRIYWSPGLASRKVVDDTICRLMQPRVIYSLNLSLWEQDDRSYSYYIETSVNREDWEMLVDFRMEQKSPLQKLRFQPRTVVFIKIVVTNSTADDQFFKCVMECPAQDEEGLKALKEEMTTMTVND